MLLNVTSKTTENSIIKTNAVVKNLIQFPNPRAQVVQSTI
ncbi:hypothetical protein HMPREF0891_0240 [Lactobacillus crispatus 214-1]|nr:hypothetical protein HMPREF0891_0240 [Lactobacillus crispatus 214-1]